MLLNAQVPDLSSLDAFAVSARKDPGMRGVDTADLTWRDGPGTAEAPADAGEWVECLMVWGERIDLIETVEVDWLNVLEWRPDRDVSSGSAPGYFDEINDAAGPLCISRDLLLGILKRHLDELPGPLARHVAAST